MKFSDFLNENKNNLKDLYDLIDKYFSKTFWYETR